MACPSISYVALTFFSLPLVEGEVTGGNLSAAARLTALYCWYPLRTFPCQPVSSAPDFPQACRTTTPFKDSTQNVRTLHRLLLNNIEYGKWITNGSLAKLGYTVPFTLVRAGKYGTEDILKIQTIQKPEKANNAKHSNTQLAWFSHFLRHSKRWAYCTMLPSPHGAWYWIKVMQIRSCVIW